MTKSPFMDVETKAEVGYCAQLMRAFISFVIANTVKPIPVLLFIKDSLY